MVEAGAKEVGEFIKNLAIARRDQKLCAARALRGGRQPGGRSGAGRRPACSEGPRRGSRIEEATAEQGKLERRDKVSDARAAGLTAVLGDEPEPEARASFNRAFDSLQKSIIRRRIAVDKKRPDGRKSDEIRPITCDVGVAPRTHGSGLFTRGETQVMSLLALGTLKDAQRIDGIGIETTKRYIHHYNFPPFSVGETGFMRGPKRRDIGTAPWPSVRSRRWCRTRTSSRTPCGSCQDARATVRRRWRRSAVRPSPCSTRACR